MQPTKAPPKARTAHCPAAGRILAWAVFYSRYRQLEHLSGPHLPGPYFIPSTSRQTTCLGRILFPVQAARTLVRTALARTVFYSRYKQAEHLPGPYYIPGTGQQNACPDRTCPDRILFPVQAARPLARTVFYSSYRPTDRLPGPHLPGPYFIPGTSSQTTCPDRILFPLQANRPLALTVFYSQYNCLYWKGPPTAPLLSSDPAPDVFFLPS